MSTRSMIACTLPDGMIRAIYSHSDGYPSYVGRYLVNYWHSEGRAARLTSMGDMSMIGKTIGKKHTLFQMPQEGKDEDWCAFYHRDRGDPANQFGCHVNTLDELVEHFQTTMCQYLYLWRHETWWMYAEEQSERDPARPGEPWAALSSVLARDNDMIRFCHAITPSPAPLLRNRSLRLWDAPVSDEPAATRSGGRRALMI